MPTRWHSFLCGKNDAISLFLLHSPLDSGAGDRSSAAEGCRTGNRRSAHEDGARRRLQERDRQRRRHESQRARRRSSQQASHRTAESGGNRSGPAGVLLLLLSAEEFHERRPTPARSASCGEPEIFWN